MDEGNIQLVGEGLALLDPITKDQHPAFAFRDQTTNIRNLGRFILDCGDDDPGAP